MNITLNEVEIRLAKFVARKRYELARKNGRPNLRLGGQSDAETDLNGAAGEIAFCKAMNIYPNLITGEIDEYDADIPYGTVDVKTTKYRNGRLLAVRSKKMRQADLYALITGEIPHFRFVGMATGSELFKDENIKDLGHGSGYVLDQSELSLYQIELFDHNETT
jgi:hypothetical protein